MVNGTMRFTQVNICHVIITHRLSDCGSLESITIPNSVTSIGEGAFQDCKSLKNIIIPNSVTSIGDSAFARCKALLNAVLSDSVTKIWARTFWECRSLKSITIPDSVTNIDELAFAGCKALKNITIPDNVVSIDECAFKDCTSLAGVTIPESVTDIGQEAFRGCKSLKSAVIPDSVTSIGYRAFWKTPVELTIPERIPADDPQKPKPETQKVEETTSAQLIPSSDETPRAYICCAKWDIEHVSTLLTELYWEGFNFYYTKTTVQQEIDDSQCVLAFFSNKTAKSELAMNKLKYAVQHDPSRIIQVFLGDCTDWPPEIRDKLHDRQAIIQSLLSEQEFTGRIRDSLRTFKCTIGHPRGFDVEKIGNEVNIKKFNPEGNFSRVIIPKTFFNPPLPVTSIDVTAFMNCESLTDITIPYGVTSIDGDALGGAFSGCKSLRSISLPDSVLSIANSAFLGCEKLMSVVIPESVTSIGDSAFLNCKSLQSVVIPNGIEKITTNTFLGCKKLMSVVIPESVTSIGNSAFSNCKSLQSVVIPSGVKEICESAFANCESLTNITIPDSVEKIDKSAFYYCTSLKAVVFLSKETSISVSDVFEYCKSLTIYAPAASYPFSAWRYAEIKNIKHGDFEKAIEYFNQAIETQRRESPKDSKKLLELLGTLKMLQIKVYGEESEAVAATCNSIGSVYYKTGGDSNIQAVEYFTIAAQQGNAEAQYSLGICYGNGRGVTQDYVKAAEWYGKAAEQGHGRAQTNLGFLYGNGRGVTQDYVKAAEWYGKAAEQGFARAQTNLGFFYGTGRGVTQDYVKAAEWYAKAAEQGDPLAQTNLGSCYRNGIGVVQDKVKAAEWFGKAAQQGHIEAQKELKGAAQ